MIDPRQFAKRVPVYCGRCDRQQQFHLSQFHARETKVCYECPRCGHAVNFAPAEAPRKGAAA